MVWSRDMGFDSTWMLVDRKAYRASPEAPATVGEVWRLARAGATWASQLQLPDRQDLGLLMTLHDVARRSPAFRQLDYGDRTAFEPGGRFAGASFVEQRALRDAIRVFDRGYWTAKERKSVTKTLKVRAEGAPELLVGPQKLAAVARLARVFEEELAADDAGWAAATAYVERPVFAAFLAILRELPRDHVLMALTV
jgi:hypothetical protein